MRDGARKMREVTDPHAGTPGEPWGWLYDLTESGIDGGAMDQRCERAIERSSEDADVCHARGGSRDVERGRVGGQV